MLVGCATYRPRPVEEVPGFLERAQTRSRAGLTVTVSVLSNLESQQIFGVNLAGEGIQPVWLAVENESSMDYTCSSRSW